MTAEQLQALVTTARDDERWRARAYWPFRLTSTVAAVLLFNQAVFAGQFLAGTFGALGTHREFATIAGIIVLVTAATAIPIRWPGRGPLWPTFASLGLFLLIAAQIALGFRRQLALHIPLGMAIILLGIFLAFWAWCSHPTAQNIVTAPEGR